MDAEIQMEEEELKTKYEGKLDKKYEAPAYEVVSSIFKVLSGKKITGPGSFQRYASRSLILRRILTVSLQQRRTRSRQGQFRRHGRLHLLP